MLLQSDIGYESIIKLVSFVRPLDGIGAYTGRPASHSGKTFLRSLMNRQLSLPAGLCLLVLAWSPQAASQSTPKDLEQKLIQLEQLWIDSTIKGDRSALDNLIHPDYVGVDPSGAFRNKASVLTAPKPPAGSKQTLRNVSVTKFGSTAILRGINELTSGTRSVPVAFTDVFVYEQGQWKVASSHMSFANGQP